MDCGKGPILEYFEPGDLKPVKTEELQDPDIEISSDSDTEEAGHPGVHLQAPRLNGLHDIQQRASLRLGPRSNDGFSNAEPQTWNTKLWGDTSSLGKRRHQFEISREKRARMAEPVPAMAPPVAMLGFQPTFQPAAVQAFRGSSPPNPATWSVVKGTHCSLLQCPQCPRKLELPSLNNHMVGKV